MPNEKPIPEQIPIEKIHDLPGVPIVKLADKSYGGLVASMLVDGVKEPVILRQREDGEYQLVSGFRRRKAAELAKLKELPALVYDMTEKEAMAYCEKRNAENPPPIPGKLIEKSDKTPSEKATLKEEKAAESKAAPAPEAKPEEKKPDAPADKKPEEKPGEKKAAEPPKPEAPKAAPAPEAKLEEKKADAPADKKPEEKPAEKKAAEPPKQEAPKATPAPAAKAEEKKAEAPTEKKLEEKPAEKKTAEPPKPEAPKATPAPDAKAVEKKSAAAPAKAPAKKTEQPVGTAAVGPTGTLITKLLGEKLNPPTEKDKKALPIPGEGEAFAVTLHPAYLKKAEINTFSVDRNSDDFKELFKSIERFGVKDPVLARFGKDGELEIISGQRRHLIASELNYPVPTIIQQLDDDDARILVADGNLHREHISSYDLSRALRMKADSMKRKAGRKLRGAKSGPETDELIAREMGMSTMKLNRLMKLSEATKQICDLVDEGKLPTSVAYNIAFLLPKHQDTVADLIGINVKVNNENTGLLKKVAASESLTEQKIRDVLEGRYPPKVVEKPKPVTPPAPAPVAPAAPAMAPASVPKSPDIPVPPVPPAAPKAPGNVIPFPSAPAVPTSPTQATPTATPVAPEKSESAAQDRENSYETRIILRGDRLRKYFPDVSMTPREIEDSIYDALEERRQRQEHAKQKAEIFGKEKKGPVK